MSQKDENLLILATSKSILFDAKIVSDLSTKRSAILWIISALWNKLKEMKYNLK